MQLIGMLDSPYVRRTAICLQLMGVPFTHRAISVFRGYAEIAAINPVVKAPTLVCDDGVVLMDSQLILDHLESLPACRRRLLPTEVGARRDALRLIGLALAAADKAVQLLYERVIRPVDKVHAPWVERQTAQLHAAFTLLEAGIRSRPYAVAPDTIDQAGVTTAVVWHFTQQALPGVVDPARCPALQRHSAAAETLAAFLAAPHGEGTYRAGNT